MTKFQLDRAAAVPGGRTSTSATRMATKPMTSSFDPSRAQAAIVARRDESNHNEKKASSCPASHLMEDERGQKGLDPRRDGYVRRRRFRAAKRPRRDIIIENASDPVFVADLDGRFSRPTKPSLSCSASARTRSSRCPHASLRRGDKEFTAALREVVERGVTRDAVLNPRSAWEVIPTSLNAWRCATPTAR